MDLSSVLYVPPVQKYNAHWMFSVSVVACLNNPILFRRPTLLVHLTTCAVVEVLKTQHLSN